LTSGSGSLLTSLYVEMVKNEDIKKSWVIYRASWEDREMGKTHDAKKLKLQF